MVAQNYGYTSVIQNDQNKQNEFADSPYYIQPILNQNYDEQQIDLTPIQKFYDSTNVFITGSTGFLGRILVEKLLRSCPVSTVYLLVRNKKGKNLEERLDELFDDIIFDRLKNECPKFRHKVVGVAGDCSLPDLGLSVQDKRVLIDEVDIVFHVAATVRFDEKLNTAVHINIRSSRDLVNLSKEMTKLKSYIHVSTIYSNCVQKCIKEEIYPAAIDGEKLLVITENLPEHILNDITPKLLGDYPNTYAFTKQIAEDIVKQNADNLPLGIFRPAIVISSYKEPIKSWVNNMYGPTGVSAGAGVGLLRTLHCIPEAIANLVPVDMCVNSLIASAWQVSNKFQKANNEQKPFQIPMYNYESGNDQPITWDEFMNYTERYGIPNPSSKCIWYYCFTLFRYYPTYLLFTFLLHTVPAFLVDTVLVCLGKKPRMMEAYSKIHKFSSVISYFSTRQWDVKSDNLRNLLDQMNEKDKEIFFSDMKQMEWQEYFKTYVTGFRQYLLHDPLDTLPQARIRWRRFYYAHVTLKTLLGLALLWMVYGLLKSL